MKKIKLTLATVLSVAAVLALVIPGLAAPAGHWLTDYTLMNLSSSSPADITVRRYSQCASGCSADVGTVVYTKQVPAGGSEYYNPGLDSGFPTNFAGSITIESTQPLAGTVTLANDLTGNAYASDAYGAITVPDSTTYLPIVQRTGVLSTRITVQNTGTTSTTVTIAYIGSGHPGNTTINNLPANMMAMVDMSDMGSLTFTGSATVSAANPLAVVVEQYKTSGGVLASYNGFPNVSADTTIYLPGYIYQRVWETKVGIASAGGSGTVTINFTGSTASLSGPVTPTSSVYLNPYAASLPAGWTGSYPTTGYYGAAIVTSTTKVAVAYNIDNGGAGGPGNLPMAYLGFPASQAGTTIVEPLIENKYSSGWLTTFSVLSIDGTPANLSMTFSGNHAPNCNPCTVNMLTATQTFDQSVDGFLPKGFIGGVKIVANKNIVVIADQNLPGGHGDSAAGFVGFMIP